MAKYKVRSSAKFRREYNLLERRHYPMQLLDDVVTKLENGETLPAKYQVHDLSGDWQGYKDCHIRGDWLLIYQYIEQELILVLMRTGTHADIFKK